jgi:4-amino-4-deoxy-L-arabinose transferase-like glycosyltransferase
VPSAESEVSGTTSPRRRFEIWRSPSDQPRWARPTLVGITAVAALAYGWRVGSTTQVFYAAADRSMSSSWHDFFFASFDPAGTISIDKLPGAFWIQAASVRVFGPHTWAIGLPQVIEGVLCILVLYRAVRRCAGPVAGALAATLLALSPASMTLNRGNVADTVLILLLVLAADSTVAALRSGRRAHLVMAGVWVGLAFQTKMLEAWLVLPALLLCHFVADAGSTRRRLASAGAMVAVALVVSLSWTAVVSLTPAHDRPYVDGTTNDSVFSQVFDYNGFGRVGTPSPNQVLGRTIGSPFLDVPSPPASATRLLVGPPGLDTGWLLPAAALSIPLLLWAKRRRTRTDLVRASTLLWGSWLLVFATVFSLSRINLYYLGALSPPIAALVSVAAVQAWEHRRLRSVQAATAIVVAVSAGYAVWLLPSTGTGLPSGLATTTAGFGFLALACIGVFAVTKRSDVGFAAGVCACLALLTVPMVASASVVSNDLGAFDTPFQPWELTYFNKTFFGQPLQPIAALPALERARNGAPDLLAAQTSTVAAPVIFQTGAEVLPIGGYDGTTPEPTLSALRAMIARGLFHIALTATRTSEARAVWVKEHCIPVRHISQPPATSLEVSYCAPGDAAGGPSR